MLTIFNVSKTVFFVLTVFIGLFALKASYVIDKQLYQTILKIIIPLYIVFAGVMFWYFIGYILALKKNKEDDEISYKNGFIIGWIIGFLMALLYYML